MVAKVADDTKRNGRLRGGCKSTTNGLREQAKILGMEYNLGRKCGNAHFDRKNKHVGYIQRSCDDEMQRELGSLVHNLIITILQIHGS